MIHGSARVDEAVEWLRAAGERVTPGRRAILEVLDECSDHVDADAVAAKLAERVPGVHRATIYRSLQTLVDVGLVSHTHVPGGATIYHLALHGHASGEAGGRRDLGGSQPFHAHGHAHLQCVKCERFTDVSAGEFAGLSARVEELTGFRIDAEHAALLGTCAECRAKLTD